MNPVGYVPDWILVGILGVSVLSAWYALALHRKSDPARDLVVNAGIVGFPLLSLLLLVDIGLPTVGAFWFIVTVLAVNCTVAYTRFRAIRSGLLPPEKAATKTITII